MNRLLRSLAITFIFLSLVNETLANRIDSLKTDNDVLEFLKSINEDFRSDKYKKVELRTTETIRHDLYCDGIADQWQVQNWEKADFNGDGRTDLLVILYWYDYGVYSVIDNGDGTYKLLTLSYNIYEKCNLAKPLKSDGQQLLLYYEKIHVGPKTTLGTKVIGQIDTLIYQQGGFIEFNRNPSKYDIDSLEFRTTYCYGSCPVFSIAMDKKGNAVYNAQTYNPKQGIFSGLIKKENLLNISHLIDYISIKHLANDYNVSWTDDQTCWVRIRFSDGSFKEIRDYGLKGTFGLRLLYSMFFDLRNNQEWK